MKSFADFISEATPRGKNIQRPVGRQPRASYKDRMRAKQRQDAVDKRQSADQHGPSFERDAKEAARRREQNKLTPDQRLDNLIGKAARELGIKLPEERRETEIGITGQPIPNRRLGPKKRHEFEKKRRENLKKRPGDAPGESKLIQLMRDRAQREGN